MRTARHALSLDEKRKDFEPTIWAPRNGVDLKQVWFAGAHADIGGSYEPDLDNSFLSDISMMWLIRESNEKGLGFEEYLSNVSLNSSSLQHNEYKGMFELLGKYVREIPNQNKIITKIHVSVKERYENSDYKSEPIEKYRKDNNGKWPDIEN